MVVTNRENEGDEVVAISDDPIVVKGEEEKKSCGDDKAATTTGKITPEEDEEEKEYDSEDNADLKLRDSNDSNDSVFHGIYSHDDITAKYTILNEAILGKGSFGVVRKCRCKQTGAVYALKTIVKNKLPDPRQLCREVDILLEVDHPHIIKLYDVYEDEKNIYLVSELCVGGELYDRVVEKSQSKEGHFSEFCAARIIKNILSAIQYCHDVKNIVHRDLKPENVLLTDKTDDAQVKVIDFGLSRHAPNQRKHMHSSVGTIYYVAPEVIAGDYTEKADVWSIGVVTYVLLCGFPPFNAGSESLTYDIMEKGACDVKFPSPAWDKITPGAIDFIKRLLTKDPDRRPSAAEALQDDWITHEHVLPLSLKNWRGTFLRKESPEAEAHRNSMIDGHDHDGQIEYVMEDHQNVFHKMLTTLRLDKLPSHHSLLNLNKHSSRRLQQQESTRSGSSRSKSQINNSATSSITITARSSTQAHHDSSDDSTVSGRIFGGAKSNRDHTSSSRHHSEHPSNRRWFSSRSARNHTSSLSPTRENKNSGSSNHHHHSSPRRGIGGALGNIFHHNDNNKNS